MKNLFILSKKLLSNRAKEILLGVAFIGTVAIVAHLLFSLYSFRPTEDGFMLAYSRRILDGQLAYRDFLSAHNIGTPLLFAPFVYFGGDYTFWITRFVVWLEFASISWIWTTLIVRKFLSVRIGNFTRIVIATIAFYFTAHSFPTMVWYTIDGLFIYSIALILCLSKNQFYKSVGYLLVGSTFLIKQNFIVLLPATIIFLGDYKSKKYWIAMLAPNIMYYAFFLFSGALWETILQTTTRTEFFQTAVRGFISQFTFPWGILLGFGGMKFLSRKKLLHAFFGSLLILAPFLYGIFYLRQNYKFAYDSSFFLFGDLVGVLIYLFFKKNKINLNYIVIALVAAWSTAISGGYNTPAFGSGIMFAYITAILFYSFENIPYGKILKRTLTILLVVVLPLASFYFYYARTHNFYSEPLSARKLTYKLDGLLAGGKNILISKATYEYLTEFNREAAMITKEKLKYATLPNFPAQWVKSKQENPLIMDAPFIFNNQTAIINPLTRNILAARGKTVFIVEKANLLEKQEDMPESVYQIALFIPKHFTKIAETNFFVLYK